MKMLLRIISFIILLSTIFHFSAYADSQEKVWLGLTVTKTENKERENTTIQIVLSPSKSIFFIKNLTIIFSLPF